MRAPGGGCRPPGLQEGLTNVRLKHILGFPTDEGAIRRLPLDRAAAAIVSADVDTEDVDTQITDSEVITSAHLLTAIFRASCLHTLRRTGVRRPPLRVILEFNDVLTQRLLELQPGLVEPQHDDDALHEDDPAHEGSVLHVENDAPHHAEGSEPGGGAKSKRGEDVRDGTAAPMMPPRGVGAVDEVDSDGMREGFVEVLAFHRQYLETSALSLSAHSHTSWRLMRRLLDARGGVDVRDVRVERVLDPTELAPAGFAHPDAPVATPLPTPRSSGSRGPRGLRGSGGGGGALGGSSASVNVERSMSETEPSPPLFSFHDLAVRVSTREGKGHGVLIGWKRGGNKPCLNPANKEEPLPWKASDLLLVVRANKPKGPGAQLAAMGGFL